MSAMIADFPFPKPIRMATASDVRGALRLLRGFGPNTVLPFDNDTILYPILRMQDIAAILGLLPPLGPYKNGVYECFNFAHEAAARMAGIWRDLGGQGQLPQGSIGGILPVTDSTGCNPICSGHRLNWFLSDQGILLREPQTMNVLEEDDLKMISLIYDIGMGS